MSTHGKSALEKDMDVQMRIFGPHTMTFLLKLGKALKRPMVNSIRVTGRHDASKGILSFLSAMCPPRSQGPLRTRRTHCAEKREDTLARIVTTSHTNRIYHGPLQSLSEFQKECHCMRTKYPHLHVHVLF